MNYLNQVPYDKNNNKRSRDLDLRENFAFLIKNSRILAKNSRILPKNAPGPLCKPQMSALTPTWDFSSWIYLNTTFKVKMSLKLKSAKNFFLEKISIFRPYFANFW